MRAAVNTGTRDNYLGDKKLCHIVIPNEWFLKKIPIDPLSRAAFCIGCKALLELILL
jgi:hypothetical protein